MQQTPEILDLARFHKAQLNAIIYPRRKKLPSELSAFKEHEISAMRLLSMEKPIELCRFFGITKAVLQEAINEPLYKSYSIPKKKGGERQIQAPGKKLKLLQRKLNYFLQAYYLCIKPEAVHGFVLHPQYLDTYCNIAENARPHVGKKAVLNIDLQDFFPSIAALRVKKLLTSEIFQFSEPLATAIALLCTFQGKLPTGAPTSPVLSNFICLALDHDLKQFSESEGFAYTRYADDLTFSSSTAITHDHIQQITAIIRSHDFVLNDKKFRLKGAHRKQTVTGLIVNEKVNIDRKLLKKIRAMLFDMKTNGIDVAAKNHFSLPTVEQKDGLRFIQRLEGYINFIGQIKGKTDPHYLQHKKEFNGVFECSKA